MTFLQSRFKELYLLIISSLLMFVGLSTVISQKHGRLIWPEIATLGIIFGSVVIVHLVLRFIIPRADNILFPIAITQSFIGLVLIKRLNENLFNLQIVWFVIGLLALLLCVVIFRNYQNLRNYKYIAAVIGLILFLSPVIVGVEKYGAKLWVQIAGFSFQPAEIGKILLILFFAAYLGERKELLSISNRKWLGIQIPPLRHLGPLMVIWAISLVILIFEKDLGSSLLFMGSFLVLIYIATSRPFYLLSGSTFFIAGAAICYKIFPHVQSRINIWLNPWVDLSGKGYQIGQSLFAIANGGLTGAGLGLGYPQTIPAATTDFIFSVLSEEMGLIGGIALISLYLIFFLRGMKIAMACQSDFGKLLSSGLVFALSFQAFIILGGVTKLIPLTGITLPFVSYGGSSLLSNFILLAFILIISNDIEDVDGRE